jgi:hypothetical protein
VAASSGIGGALTGGIGAGTDAEAGAGAGAGGSFNWSALVFGGFMSLFHRAAGGTVLGGSSYIVGERSPELFVAPSTGSIIPNNRLSQGYGEGYTNVSTIINIHQDGSTERQTSGNPGQHWGEMTKSIENIVKATIQKEQRLGNSLKPLQRGRL